MDFYTRLLEERDQLKARIKGLKSFLESGQAANIDKTQVSLLKVQLPIMESYHIVLQERIDLITNTVT